MKNLNVFIAFMLLIVLSFACEKENVEIQTDANQLELVQDRSNGGEVLLEKGKKPLNIPACVLGIPDVDCYETGEPYTFTTGASPSNTIVWSVAPIGAGYVASGQGTTSAQIEFNAGYATIAVRLKIYDENNQLACVTSYPISPLCDVLDPPHPSCADIFIDGIEGCVESGCSHLVTVGGVTGIMGTQWTVLSGDMTVSQIVGNNGTEAVVQFGPNFNGGVLKAEVITDAGIKCVKLLTIDACVEEPECECPLPKLLAVSCNDDLPGQIAYRVRLIGGYEAGDDIEWSVGGNATLLQISTDQTQATVLFSNMMDGNIEPFSVVYCEVTRECEGDEYARTGFMSSTSSVCDYENYGYTTADCVIN